MLVTLTIPSTRLTREHTVCTHTGAPAPPPFHRAVGPSPIIYIVVARNAVCARLHHTINHTHDENATRNQALFIQNCYTRLGLPSQGIRERPWQRDVEPWDDWSARVARVVGRGRRILLVPLQRPRAHDDRADGGEGTRGPGRVGDASESYPRGHLDGWMDGWMDGWTVGYQALPTSS